MKDELFEHYETIKLIDILKMDNNEDKKSLLLLFKQFLLDAKKDRLAKIAFNIDDYLNLVNLSYENLLDLNEIHDNLNMSIDDLCYDWSSIELEHTSEYFLDGHIIFLYPKIRELIASKDYLCEFGGFRIYKGNMYYRCKLFIEDYTDNSVYVTKDLTISEDYIDYFPTSVQELNDFFYRIDSAYNRDDEDYYNISCNLSNTRFGLKLLKKKR